MSRPLTAVCALALALCARPALADPAPASSPPPPSAKLDQLRIHEASSLAAATETALSELYRELRSARAQHDTVRTLVLHDLCNQAGATARRARLVERDVRDAVREGRAPTADVGLAELRALRTRARRLVWDATPGMKRDGEGETRVTVSIDPRIVREREE